MRIGIANDLPIATQLLRRVVLLRPETTVVWTARDGAEAIAMCAKDTPDLILMDLIMPITDGVQATKQIMAKTPCAILVVTTSIDINADRVFEAMGYGALDAVDTPVLGTQDLRESAKPLLALVDRVAQMNASRTQRLVAKPAPRRPREPAYNGRMVAIGASAGGPAALAQLLAGLPKDFPAAIVVVQHVDEKFASGMAEWLNQISPLPVRVAKEGDRPVIGGVLLAGSGDHLALKTADKLGYCPDPRDSTYRPSVDVFFESISLRWKGEAAAVLLTGMGRDGAVGLRALRDKGWHTIAQDEKSSAVYGMPKAAKELDAAVDILPLDQIAPKLRKIFAS
ncbi:MAG TPA: chemotaxis response regulator protein-glutamate methylesterase [Gammaproteobacteria bacterium]|nr:chemotaxis response regulator protein-glutamate methylesterase [Gammaproteobacteria bacterium]